MREDDEAPSGGAGRSPGWLPLWGLGILAFGIGLYWFLLPDHGPEPVMVTRIQQVAVVRPPPPPQPPPPEPEIPEPEPEWLPPEPELAAPEPEEAPPPGPDLGIDAEGGIGGDAFGLVGRPGGRGLIGGGRTGTGTLAGWYTGVLQRDLQAFLEGQDDLRRKHYTVVVRLWLSEDGRVERSKLETSSGDPTIDASIENALNSGFRVSERPPEVIFQAVKIRLSSRT